jgi:hypothetical protein
LQRQRRKETWNHKTNRVMKKVVIMKVVKAEMVTTKVDPVE